MQDGGRVEGRKRLTGRRRSHPHPRDQGHHHEHQARQRRRSGADDDVKVLPGGKWRQQCLLHDGSSFPGQCQRKTTHPRERGRRMRHDWVACITEHHPALSVFPNHWVRFLVERCRKSYSPEQRCSPSILAGLRANHILSRTPTPALSGRQPGKQGEMAGDLPADAQCVLQCVLLYFEQSKWSTHEACGRETFSPYTRKEKQGWPFLSLFD